jgi:hypothetical protein
MDYRNVGRTLAVRLCLIAVVPALSPQIADAGKQTTVSNVDRPAVKMSETTNAEYVSTLKRELERRTLPYLLDATLTSPFRTTFVQAILSASIDNNIAAAEVGFRVKEVDDSEFRLTAKLSGPVKKDQEEATLATLEDLTDNTTLTIGFQLQIPNPEKKIVACSTSKLTDSVNQHYAEQASKDLSNKAPTLTDIGRAASREVIRDVIGQKGMITMRVQGTYAAEKTYYYLAPGTLSPQKEIHDGYSLQAAISWVPVRWPAKYLVGVSYTFESSYQGKSKKQICTPLGTSGALSCRDIAVGAPSEVTRHLLRFEVRGYIVDGQLGFSPRFTVDMENDVRGVECPFYFLKDGKGNLNGGVSVGWRSDSDDVIFSAFVGALTNPFS